MDIPFRHSEIQHYRAVHDLVKAWHREGVTDEEGLLRMMSAMQRIIDGGKIGEPLMEIQVGGRLAKVSREVVAVASAAIGIGGKWQRDSGVDVLPPALELTDQVLDELDNGGGVTIEYSSLAPSAATLTIKGDSSWVDLRAGIMMLQLLGAASEEVRQRLKRGEAIHLKGE